MEKKKTAKKGAGKNAQQDALAKELRALIPKLDCEGLAFLLEQARIHLYNMQVEKLNNAAVAANAASERAAATRGRKPVKTGNDSFRLDGTESGSSFYLNYRNDSIMFSRDEMIRLVKIASSPGTDPEIRERLYNWFERERKDIFALVPIQDKSDARLKSIAAVLKKSFKLKSR